MPYTIVMYSPASTAAGGEGMTLAEWAVLEEDEPGELVDGVLEEEEVPDCLHELCVSWLIHALRDWLAPRRGFVFGSDVKFGLKPRRGRKPDVSVFLPGGTVPPRYGVVAVPPDIMVEVVSSTPRDVRRDRLEKMDEYAAFGVRFYWIIEPEARTLEVFQLVEGGRYLRVLGASRGQVSEIPGCEGLAIDLDALWAETDALGREPE